MHGPTRLQSACQGPSPALIDPVRMALVGAAILFLSSAASAEIRYVAASGKDANPCTLTAPCKTLQRGVNVTPGDGELRVLSSGTYGAATITRSLTLSGDASVTVRGQITINAAGATMVLRGLHLNGAGIADANGIYIRAAGSVHIERCEIERFTAHGIYYPAAGANLVVSDSISRDNGLSGLFVNDDNATPSAFGPAKVVVEDSSFENNAGDGIFVHGGAVAITRVTLSGNNANGLNASYATVNISETIAVRNRVTGFLLQRTRATVASSLGEGNETGLFASGLDASLHTVTISSSTFVNNSVAGIGVASATGRTRGNNTVIDNPTNVIGTLTPLDGV